MFAWMLGRRRDLLLLLTLARPGSAWVLFDGKRLEQAVPRGQAAKNGSDILSPAETVRLVLDDNFPGAFRWSARPALRYAISPDFCAAMKGTMVEEDKWLVGVWPFSPPIQWTSCDRLHQIVRQAFETWQENNPALHFIDVTDRCTTEKAWLPIPNMLCAGSAECVELLDTEGRAGPGSSVIDDNNRPEVCSTKTCFTCERADILIGAFVQGGRQLADAGSRMRILDRMLSDQPPLGTNGVVQPGGKLDYAKLEVLVDKQYFADYSGDPPTFDGDGGNFTQLPHCWRLDADWCPDYVRWGQAHVNTTATALFGMLFAVCLCACLCGCLMCLQRLVTNLLAGWDLDQDGKVEIHEIMYVLDEFCGEICFECRCPKLHNQKMSKLEGVLGVFESITQMNAVLSLLVVGFCIFLPIAFATEVSNCWSCADFRAALVHEVGHLLALDNSDAYSTNATFTHANDSSPYPPYETSTLDCFNPEWGVVLGTPADAEQSVMRDFLLTNADEPPPRRCLSTDDLAALNYLYPSCSGAMLIHPACGARASGRAPAMRLLQNFGTVFSIPALVLVSLKILAQSLLSLQTWWAEYKLRKGANAVVSESRRQTHRFKFGHRKRLTDEQIVQKNIDRAKRRKARREKQRQSGRDLLRLGIGKRAKPKEAYAAAPAPEAAAEGAPAMASPFKTPGRRALEEEIKMVADHTQGKAAGLDKWGKKVTTIQMARIGGNTHEAQKNAAKMAAKAAELKRVAAESSDYSNVPVREGIEEQDRYERTVMNAAGNDGGVTYMQKPGTKGKGKAKAPTGSVAEELGY